MFETNTVASKPFTAGFELMTSQLQQILQDRNQTVVELYRDLAIEWVSFFLRTSVKQA